MNRQDLRYTGTFTCAPVYVGARPAPQNPIRWKSLALKFAQLVAAVVIAHALHFV